MLIESLAAGTPVIALRRGSVPEILEDGVTGFICEDVDEMVAAVGRLDQIDPDACRAASHEFTGETMCRRYVEAYEQVQHRRPPVLSRVCEGRRRPGVAAARARRRASFHVRRR